MSERELMIGLIPYKNDEGEYIRVSTEHMPDNGEEAFDKIESAVSRYTEDE